MVSLRIPRKPLKNETCAGVLHLQHLTLSDPFHTCTLEPPPRSCCRVLSGRNSSQHCSRPSSLAFEGQGREERGHLLVERCLQAGGFLWQEMQQGLTGEGWVCWCLLTGWAGRGLVLQVCDVSRCISDGGQK